MNKPYIPQARYVTKRDYSRKTDGHKVAAIAKALGTPLIPAQQYIADVAGEIDPVTGSYYYTRVIVTVQRQFGKTTTTFSKMGQNALLGPKRQIWYLAQKGKDADAKVLDFIKTVRETPLAQLTAKPTLGKGSISLPFINGSVIQPSPPNDDSGHGFQGDLIEIDEAWSLSAEQGKTILDAFLPTTTTRLKLTGVQPQIWITSTEGDTSSVWFNELIDQCRSGDFPKRWAFFDFGIPFDADPFDLDTVAQWHPACGYLFDKNQLPSFMDEYKTKDGFDTGGWTRAFGNVRDIGRTDRFINESLWNSTMLNEPMTPDTLISSDGLALGVASTIDATKTIIAIAKNDGNQTTIQLAELLDGTGEAPSRLRQLQEKYDAPIVMDKRGPAGDLYDRLTHEDMSMLDMDATEFMASGQALISALEQNRAQHVKDTVLDDAAKTATRQWAGDAWKVRRKDGDGSAILESAILAHWGATHIPEPAQPRVLFLQ